MFSCLYRRQSPRIPYFFLHFIASKISELVYENATEYIILKRKNTSSLLPTPLPSAPLALDPHCFFDKSNTGRIADDGARSKVHRLCGSSAPSSHHHCFSYMLVMCDHGNLLNDYRGGVYDDSLSPSLSFGSSLINQRR